MLAEPLKNPQFRKSFFGASLGTLLEYYDYALFPIFMPIFAPLYFPASNIYESLSKGYVLLLIPLIMRPVGGLVFGYVGDLLGRRRALLTSMYGIAIATMLIGLTPSCQTLGVGATILLLLAKMVQVFCFGGEYNGAGIYVVEHAQNKNESLISALLAAFTILGSLAATLLGLLATSSFMPDWSWRLAFILGGIVGLLSIRYRKNLIEPPQFKVVEKERYSFRRLLKDYPRELTAGMLIGAMGTLPFTTLLVFTVPVFMAKGLITNHQLMQIHTLLIAVAIAAVIPAGWLGDRFSPQKVMSFGALSLSLLAYPLLWLIDQGQVSLLVFSSIIFIIINETLLGPSHAYLKNIFSLHYRYRGSSMSFCFGMSIIGGLTPIIENSLYRMTGSFLALSIWLIPMGVATFFSMRWVNEHRVRMETAMTTTGILA